MSLKIESLNKLKSYVLNKVIDDMFFDIIKKNFEIDFCLDNTNNYFNEIEWYTISNFNDIYMEIKDYEQEIINSINDEYYHNYLEDKDYKEFYIVDYLLNKYVLENINIIKLI